MPYLAKIILCPVKLLAGVNAETATVPGSGALQYDRQPILDFGF
jgi:uncharacterized protein YcbX